MYHIKNDKRVQKSASLIVNGLNVLLQTMPFEKITVSNILEVSTVGRATFYRLFDSAVDVLRYESDLMFEKIINNQSKIIITDKWLLQTIQIFMDNSPLLEAIVDSNQTSILFVSQYQNMDKIPFDIPESEGSEAVKDYLLSSLTYLMIGTLITWIHHQKKETSEELLVILKSNLTTLQTVFVDRNL